MKKYLAIFVAFALVMGSAMPVYAGGHHGNRGKTSTPKAAWHDATDYYGGHYSNQCADYDHVWHSATTGCLGHYSYACYEYDNCVWNSDTKSYRDSTEKPANPPKAQTQTRSYRGLRGGCCGGGWR